MNGSGSGGNHLRFLNIDCIASIETEACIPEANGAQDDQEQQRAK